MGLRPIQLEPLDKSSRINHSPSAATHALNLSMGFFDRFTGKSKPSTPANHQPSPEPEPAADNGAADTTQPTGDTSPVGPRLQAALELLEIRNLDDARTIYEEVLNSPAGNRPDVLVRISGDLGATGHIAAIPELIAPRYDAERHGPATGINLLQAYLALHRPESAQHVLDLLFALKKPEIEERLWGFSNAIAEAMESNRHSGGDGKTETKVELVSISKPIWSYGLESMSDLLPEKDPATKTVAFAQIALPDHDNTDELSQKPEEALGRFCRGLPMWLAESLYFSPQYNSLGVVGILEQKSYMMFPVSWTADNIRQLTETSGFQIDYVVTGDLREQDGDYELSLRLWEIKGFRERKSFQVQWTPATADKVLGELHEHLRLFFECREGPGLPYQAPTSAMAWINTLAASLTTFLGDKNVLPPEHIVDLPSPLIDPSSGDAAALARLTLADRAQRAGLEVPDAEYPDTESVKAAQSALTP
ncbi:hypothetical protein N9023_05730 [Opitutaceae bacterium]|nr:hypothetical protein [Opitutaceae bacterium]